MWETWEVRWLILTSLLIQAILTFVAPFRKRCSHTLFKSLIWTLYLLADAVAIYIVGLISRQNSHFTEKSELLALWAPFLLLHLGGPDTITAFALEDNELWRRHVLQLSVQVTLTLHVFGRSLRHSAANDNDYRLLVPTLLMFFDGFIKYFERTRALFYSSKDNFRESVMMVPGSSPNYERLVEEYHHAKNFHLPAEFHYYDDGAPQHHASGDVSSVDFSSVGDAGAPILNNQQDDTTIKNAYRFYEMCKPLLADGFLTVQNRRLSRSFFLSKSLSEAVMIIQIELNLMYDAFYTKSFLLQGRKAQVTRVLCFVFVIVAFVLFCVEWDLKANETDAIVTFILFSGAITLEMFAFFTFTMSDWGVIFIHVTEESRISSVMASVLKWLRKIERPLPSKRWSETIYSFNLLEYCFKKPRFLRIIFKPISRIKYVKDFCIAWFCVKSETIDPRLLFFVLNKIFEKAVKASDVEVAKEVFNARGNLVLEDHYYLVSELLSPWTVDVEFEESVLLWHLATDLCYTTAKYENYANKEGCMFSKKISDYMLYLIIRQPSLLSAVAGMADIRFHDTCEEAKKATEKHETEDGYIYKFCHHVMGVKAIVEPMISKHKKSKSVLYNAVRLAMQLEMFEDHKWVIISRVWVELLCYAAARCSPRSHIARLNNGGELITIVWLCMAHLGLGERYLKTDEYGWNYRLIIDK